MGALVGVAINEIFDFDFSVFQAALIGAAAGYVAAEFIAGIGLSMIEGTGGKIAGATLFGAVGGILGAVGANISLAMITQNNTFKDNIDQAFMIGAGVGAIVGNGMYFFADLLDKQIYGRLNLIPFPLEYANAFPGDVVSGALFIGGSLICGGKTLSRGGESCEF